MKFWWLILLSIPAVFGQFDRSECGISKGCHIPEADKCPENCRGMGMSWKLLDESTLELELFVNANSSTGRYVAVGFSEDDTMGNESVIECSSLGTEPASMKFSFDKEKGKSNSRISGDYSSHFTDTKISFENGVLYCKSKVRITGDEANDQVFKFDPTKQYHLLLVNGMTKANGLIHHHPSQDAVSPKVFLDDINFGFDDSTCGDTKKCTIPKESDCYGPTGYGLGVAYKILSDNEIEFELFGPANTSISDNVYIALGFSNDTHMNDISVIECSKLPSEKMPTVKFSYNPGFLNARIDGEEKIREEYITQKEASIKDSKIYCRAVVRVDGVAENPEIFKWDPNRGYHLMMATGMTDDTGLTHHTGDCHTNDAVYLSEIAFNEDECEDSKACFQPTDCDGGCDDIQASWRVIDDKQIAVEITAKVADLNHYIAMGFSKSGGMGNTSVIDCTSFQNQPYKMSYSYNFVNDTAYRNIRPTSDVDSLISNEKVKFADGVLYCSATFKMEGDANDPAVFQYDPQQEYYIIVAAGASRNGSDAIGYHFKKRSVSEKLLLSDVNPTEQPGTTPSGTGTFDPSSCSKTKACYNFNAGDYFSYSITNQNTMEVEFFSTQSSSTGVYMAVGFGLQNQMGPANVIECSSLGTQSMSLKFSYNGNGKSNVRIANEAAINSQYFSGQQYSYQNGQAYCKGTVNIGGDASNSQIFKYDPSQKYYLLVAKGSANAGGLSYHGPTSRWVSSQRLLSDLGAGSASGSTVTLVILHAVFMTVAWLILVPIAVIFARVLRASWPNSKPMGLLIWFHIHRGANLVAIALMIAGFVFILVQNKWKFASDGWGGKHAIVGIIALILAWLQPFVSTLRCSPGDPRRPIFNYIHRAIGITAFAFATAAICIAAYHFTSTRQVAQLVLSLIPITVLFGVSIFFIIFNFIFDNDSNVKKNGNSTSQRVEDIPMRPTAKNNGTTTWVISSTSDENSKTEPSSSEKEVPGGSWINLFRETIVLLAVISFITIGTILAVFFGTGLSA